VSASRAVDAGAEVIMGDRQWFILYVIVCLEVGIFLTLVPWSAIWERNYFLEAYPLLRDILLAPALRGAVAGLGLANIYMGLREVLTRRRGTSPLAPFPGSEGAQREDETPKGQRQAVVASDDRA
jgi:hypothetical protein